MFSEVRPVENEVLEEDDGASEGMLVSSNEVGEDDSVENIVVLRLSDGRLIAVVESV